MQAADMSTWYSHLAFRFVGTPHKHCPESVQMTWQVLWKSDPAMTQAVQPGWSWRPAGSPGCCLRWEQRGLVQVPGGHLAQTRLLSRLCWDPLRHRHHLQKRPRFILSSVFKDCRPSFTPVADGPRSVQQEHTGPKGAKRAEAASSGIHTSLFQDRHAIWTSAGLARRELGTG